MTKRARSSLGLSQDEVDHLVTGYLCASSTRRGGPEDRAPLRGTSPSLQRATDEVASGSVLAETLLTCANPYAAEGDVPCIVLPRAPAIRTMRAKNVRKHLRIT